MKKEYGFPPNVRLKTPSDFQAVFQDPIRSRSSFFTVLAHPNGMENARLGVIVAKRYAKKAVFRNKVRRLIRESFRHKKNVLAGLDFVVLLKREFHASELATHITKHLDRHWREVLKLWKNGSLN